MIERFFAQSDAETMIGEGRYWVSRYFEYLANEDMSIYKLCKEAADLLESVSKYAQEMTAIREGMMPSEEAL